MAERGMQVPRLDCRMIFTSLVPRENRCQDVKQLSTLKAQLSKRKFQLSTHLPHAATSPPMQPTAIPPTTSSTASSTGRKLIEETFTAAAKGTRYWLRSAK